MTILPYSSFPQTIYKVLTVEISSRSAGCSTSAELPFITHLCRAAKAYSEVCV